MTVLLLLERFSRTLVNFHATSYVRLHLNSLQYINTVSIRIYIHIHTRGDKKSSWSDLVRLFRIKIKIVIASYSSKALNMTYV